MNGTQITQATELYNYRAYLETLLSYGNEAADSHLTNSFWYLDEGNIKGGDCTKPTETTNSGFVTRWQKMKKSQTNEMYGRIHSDICNVPLYLLNGIKIQIKLTKTKQAFFLLDNKADAKVKFVYKEARFHVKRIRPSINILAAQMKL